MKISITKKNVTLFVMILWSIFALFYIMNDLWQDFKVSQLSAVYNQARTETIQQIIEESTKCQPFNIYNGENKVDLIAVVCLQQQKPESGE